MHSIVLLLLHTVSAMAATYDCSVPANAGIKSLHLEVAAERDYGEVVYEYNSGLNSKPHRCVGDVLRAGDKIIANSYSCVGPSVIADDAMVTILIAPNNNSESLSIRFLAKETTRFVDFSPAGPNSDCRISK